MDPAELAGYLSQIQSAVGESFPERLPTFVGELGLLHVQRFQLLQLAEMFYGSIGECQAMEFDLLQLGKVFEIR